MDPHQGQCPFCDASRVASAVAKLGRAYAVPDLHPVTPGHVLVIPVRHVEDFFGMTREEKTDCAALVEELRGRILNEDPSVAGFNVGVNCGEAAGQTVMHAHVHLIPRRRGDTPRPRGGVRGVIPEKMAY